MSTQEIKLSISNIIQETNDQQLLLTYYDLLRTLVNFKKREVLGYDVHGKPIAVTDLEKQADAALEKVRKGQALHHEKLLEKIKKG